MTDNTSWPSYYIKQHINNVAGMLKGVKEISLTGPGEVEISLSDDLTKQSIFQLFGEITRGVRISYSVEESTEK